MPFKLSQSVLTSCGRGYSGSGLLVSTRAAHRVINGACFICQAPRLPAAIRHRTKNHARFSGNGAEFSLRAGWRCTLISRGRCIISRRQPLELLIKMFKEDESRMPTILMIFWAGLLDADALPIDAGKRPKAMWHEMAT